MWVMKYLHHENSQHQNPWYFRDKVWTHFWDSSDIVAVRWIKEKIKTRLWMARQPQFVYLGTRSRTSLSWTQSFFQARESSRIISTEELNCRPTQRSPRIQGPRLAITTATTPAHIVSHRHLHLNASAELPNSKSQSYSSHRLQMHITCKDSPDLRPAIDFLSRKWILHGQRPDFIPANLPIMIKRIRSVVFRHGVNSIISCWYLEWSEKFGMKETTASSWI